MTTRRPLTRAQRVKVFDNAKGVCHWCKTKIHVGQKWECEHVVPIWFGGPDDLENMAPIHLEPCHREKTGIEATQRAKETRVRAKHLGVAKSGKPMRGGRHSSETITFNNGVQRRRSGPQKHQDFMADRYSFGWRPE